MPPYKPRTLPLEIEILRILNVRDDLPKDVKWKYENLEKGFAGEVKFDGLTENLQSNCYVLNDLLLKFNNTTFQLDTTIIFSDKICPLEVKNYKGDFTYHRESLESATGKHYPNPIDQNNRSSLTLDQLLHWYGFNIKLERNVVYVNPAFTLFSAPKDQPMILPTQLNKFMKNLDEHPSRLNVSNKKLADLLVSLHMADDPYPRLPPYRYEQLKKGIICRTCHSLNVSVSCLGSNPKVLCGVCGYEEKLDNAVLRCVREIRILFPRMKITTKLVEDWCNNKVSYRVIYRVLTQNFKGKGSGRWVYYE